MKRTQNNVPETSVPQNTIAKKRYPAKPTPAPVFTTEVNYSIALKFSRFIFNELKMLVKGKTILSMQDDEANNYVSFVFVNKRYCVTLGIKEMEGAEA